MRASQRQGSTIKLGNCLSLSRHGAGRWPYIIEERPTSSTLKNHTTKGSNAYHFVGVFSQIPPTVSIEQRREHIRALNSFRVKHTGTRDPIATTPDSENQAQFVYLLPYHGGRYRMFLIQIGNPRKSRATTHAMGPTFPWYWTHKCWLAPRCWFHREDEEIRNLMVQHHPSWQGAEMQNYASFILREYRKRESTGI